MKYAYYPYGEERTSTGTRNADRFESCYRDGSDRGGGTTPADSIMRRGRAVPDAVPVDYEGKEWQLSIGSPH